MISISDAILALNKVKFKLNEITGCKLAINGIETSGYTHTVINNKRIYTHRLAAYVHLGLNLLDINSLVLHKQECPNRNCFNHHHLYIGSYKDNAKDKSAIGNHPSQKKLKCKYGHELDWHQKDSKTGKYYRTCLTCKRLATKRYRSKK